MPPVTAPEFRPDGSIALPIVLAGDIEPTLVILRPPRLGELRAIRAELEQMTADHLLHAQKVSEEQKELAATYGGVVSMPIDVVVRYRQMTADSEDSRIAGQARTLASIVARLAGVTIDPDDLPAWVAEVNALGGLVDHWQTVPTRPGSVVPA